MEAKKNLVILGSTGSIGRNTCDVVRSLGDHFKVVGLAAKDEVEDILEQIEEFRPRLVALHDVEAAEALRRSAPSTTQVLAGPEGLTKVAALEEADLVVCAVVGAVGLLPVFEALRCGKDVALATKEVLVTAGEIITRLAQEKGRQILPIDSEHSALHQCLRGEDVLKVRRLILTASGGPFFADRERDLSQVTPAQALRHPRWDMGNKVTIDSATLMNKALEVIEARWLFGIPLDQIDVVIHPESIIHSMVEFVDGAMMAQMSVPDMRIPIQYALTYPERVPGRTAPFDFCKNNRLTFSEADAERFPCLRLGREAAETGGTMPTVLNAANEVAVEKFLDGEIRFTDIPRWIEAAIRKHNPIPNPTIEDVLEVDARVRKEKYL
ncbi:MAG: 1-deoxy-D-xylulose-5-phosphate reductoisomerase [bacterium]|nr:1-deoxy-D-xylulose-5-phosphate reductoisomerase [bacterium]